MTAYKTDLSAAALNAATLARDASGDRVVQSMAGLTADDVKRARALLEHMPQTPLTTAFDRSAYLIASGWRPART